MATGGSGKPRPLTERQTAVMARIEALLSERRLTWAALARATGKSTSSGSQWSGRLSFPSAETLEKMADALGVPVAALHTEGNNHDRETVLLEAWRALSRREQDALLACARGLRGSLGD